LFGKFSRRSRINSWSWIRGIGTVTGFPMDLGFLDVFPGFGFQNKVRFSVIRSGFNRIWINFFWLFSFFRVSDRSWTIHSKDKVKINSLDRIGFFGQDWIWDDSLKG
jgi:hypothetical protein